MRTLPETARATVAEHGMLPARAVALALVSGGADSTALLRLLASGGLGEVRPHVLHVDHLLRGNASAADAAWVETLCKALGVSCRVVRYDVGTYAGQAGLNVEDAGRRVRYRFAEEELDALCDAAGTPREDGRILTAHTLDDRVETFLMRAVQGAGMRGLAGIPPVRGRIVRPLADVRRAEIEAYLRGLGQEWREDATNADVSRLRARVRHETVPALRAIDPAFDRTLARTLAVLSEEDRLLDAMAAEAGGWRFAGGSLEFDRARVAALPRALARRVVRMGLLAAFPEASRLEGAHVDALVAGMAEARFARDLPGGLRAVSEYATMMLCRGDGGVPAVAPSLLEIPGTAHLGSSGTLTAQPADPGDVSGGPDSVVVDASALRGPLVVDAARVGDRMRPLGMEGKRKLSDMLTDAKVPRRLRPATPVVRDGEAVVWLAGVRMAEDYRVGPLTERAVRLTWRRER